MKYFAQMGIGESIRERRIELGLTQQDLADYAGVSLRMIVSIENGKANPSLSAVNKIAGVLGLKLVLKLKEVGV